MNKKYYKPSKNLSSYVDRYFICKQFEKLPLILPGTGLELLFHINESFNINNQTLSQAHILCPRTHLKINTNSKVNYIAVRFKSGAFRHFSPLGHTEFINSYLSVEDLWKNSGKTLISKLQETSEINDKIQLIEQFLISKLSKYQIKETTNWDGVITSLYKNFNTINLQELACNTNLSYRQFERNFKQHFGITSKKFQRIARLQNTVKQVLLSKNTHYLHIALDNGYYDQSHFIKDFFLLSGTKPSNYFTMDNFDNHFYYKSLV
ncbi:AraC family transcriptional regulator [uncultured Tenacibaculum sp.]|uniref:helix-turn-helix domain-containing protein n=1 Tax=uncultured Tenacibaculum sp. TaxID=174713 RepID=UPI0026146B76|nr:AraC family transcriptional regulator [uncultured Tenacibaculum sp.]